MAGVTLGALITTFLINVSITVGLTILSRALSPSRPSTSPKDKQAGSWNTRIQQSDSPIAPREIVYGEVRNSGPTAYKGVTSDGKYLHLIVLLSATEVEDIPVVFLDDYPIYMDELNAKGYVVASGNKFKGRTRIVVHKGSPTQAVDAGLENAVSKWTSNHRLRGIAYIYLRLQYDRDVFSTLPLISAYIKGKKIRDIRLSSTSSVFSINPALILRDYMTTSVRDMGVGFETADIDRTLLAATANTCEEFVDVTDIDYMVHSRKTDSLAIETDNKAVALQTGDRVTVGGVTRYVAFYKPFQSKTNKNPQIKLATSFTNAVAGVTVDVPVSGGTITKIAEPRYTCAGVLDTTQTPRNNISDIVSSMGGKAVYSEGKWKIKAGVYESPIVVFDESDIISPIKVQTKHSLRERFNAVKGQYFSPANLGVVAEYPQIVNALYQAEDNGERIFSTLDQPFVNRAHTAQRLAKIQLEKHRQAIVFNASFKLSALQVQAGDNVYLTISRMGWSRKVFEIIEWQFIGNTDDNGVPVFTVDMTLQETASGVFDWNMGQETTVDLAPNTNLGDPLTPVTGITISFEVIIGEDGTAYTSMVISWDLHENPSVTSYSVEYRQTGSLEWIPAGVVTADSSSIRVEPVKPNTAYEARVRARNTFGFDSDYSYFISTGVIGDRDAPGIPTNIVLDGTPGGYNVMWVNPLDLDLDVVEIWERKIP